MNPWEVAKLQGAVGRIRANLHDASRVRGDALKICRSALAVLELRADIPVIGTFVTDTRRALESGTWDFARTRNEVFASEEPILLGVFKVPYMPTFTCEFLSYERLTVPTQGSFPRMPRPVAVRSFTPGFELKECVAVFAEHYHTSEVPSDDQGTLYFPQRFESRLLQFTMPVLSSCYTEASFPRMSRAPESLLRECCSARVVFHDYFHQSGPLVFPHSLPRKSSRSAAALEELRADLGSYLACRGLLDVPISYDNSDVLAEYVLSQRLHYTINSDPNEHYDALSSQVLHTFLASRGAVRVDDKSKVSLVREQVDEGCQELFTLLTKTDERSRTEPVTVAKALYRSLVARIGGYDEHTGAFVDATAVTSIRSLLGLAPR